MALFDWLFGRSPEPQQRDQQQHAIPDGLPPQIARAPARPAFARAHCVPEGSFRFIALDVETACSDVASICQIGLACVQPDNQIQTFSMLVNPGTRFDPFNIQLHGIGPDHVTDAPRFSEALAALLPLLTGHHLVQHSNFDKQAVNAACAVCGIATPDLRWSDSVTIARRAWPELKGNGGHGLANLKRKLNLQFHHHDAGEDARAAAMVVLHAEAHLRSPFEELIKPPAQKRYAAAITIEGNPSGALVGSVVVFTGALGMSRSEAAELAARVGMTVKASVTKETTHLVVGDQDLTVLAGHAKSSKHRKAEEMQSAGYPVQILGEREFKALVANARAV
ncbi:exonuclease domain-containing protein [Defluviimonas sp. WL0024]|uniref:Exonuclease domain-containing protein n=1 Tax=Albidovulum salinarum TaxID=2984153 RepID=A0ABT2X7N9_9RHOB|nr:exonuclease domain-containing protein [Defluviimonas sp. WL0024]MCU9849369.1 exonuclease domain-containing protein [Defluviimonas sp. WL0024]